MSIKALKDAMREQAACALGFSEENGRYFTAFDSTNGVLLGAYLDELLEAGLDAVNVSMDDAIANLLSLTGERVTDAVVDEVFSRFCVGK